MPGERTATNRKPPTRQEEMSAESQRRLRAAAVRLFAERGYRGASLQDIGEAAGISRGSITWHFKSKAGLLEAIVADIIERTLEALDAVPDDDTTPLDAWLELYRDLVQNDPEARIFPMLLLEAIGPDSELRPSYARFHSGIRGWTRKRLVIAQARGDLDPALDAGALAATIWAALVGAHLQWRLDADFDIAAVTTTLAALVPLRPRPASPAA